MTGTSEIVTNSFEKIWADLVTLIPNLLLAIILLFAGFIFAWIFSIIAKKILRVIRFEEIAAKIGLHQLLHKAGLKTTMTLLFSNIVYWFILIVFIASAVNVLGLTQLSVFFDSLIGYLPSVIAAVAIIIIGILVANLLYGVVKNATQSANIASSKLLASLTKWAIFIFSFIAALVQLKVAPDLLKILFTGCVVMFSLAGGLAFGLGGKDAAKEIIDKLKGNKY